MQRIFDTPIGKGIAGAVGLAFIWELLPYLLGISPLIMPPFHSVIKALFNDWALLLGQTAITGLESILAWLFALIIAGVLTSVMDIFPLVDKFTLYPLLAVQNVPKVALVPLIIVWWGHGLPPVIVMGVLVAFFPVFEGYRKGYAHDRTGIRVVFGPLCENNDTSESTNRIVKWGRLVRAKTVRLLKIKLPEAMPDIMHGSRLGMTLATVGVIVGELQAPDRGLGRVISDTDLFKIPLQYAAVLAVSVLGVLLYGIVVLLEYTPKLRPYKYNVSSVRESS